VKTGTHLAGILGVLLLGGAGAATAAAAEGGMGGLFRPWPEGQVSRGGVNVRLYTKEDVEGSDQDFSMWGFGVGDTVPLLKREGHEVLFSVNYRNLQVNTGARLPRSPEDEFPEDLHRLNFGLAYRRDFGAGRTGVLRLGVGSASDELFSDDSTVVSATALARLPHGGGRNAWLLGLSYRNRRGSEDLDHLPMPTVAYQLAFPRRNWAVIGFPYSGLHLETERRIKLDLSYMLLRTVRAKVAYGLTEKSDVYAAFAWESESYWREARDDPDDRLAFNEKRLGLGYSHEFSERVSLGLEAGWSFDRFVYEDEDYDDRDENWLEFEDALYARLALKISF
jgi:hypothetical protein